MASGRRRGVDDFRGELVPGRSCGTLVPSCVGRRAEDGIDVSYGEPPWVDLTPTGHKMKQLPARAFQPATPETTRRFMFGCSCAQLIDVSFGRERGAALG